MDFAEELAHRISVAEKRLERLEAQECPFRVVPSARVYRNAVQTIPHGAWPPSYISFTHERWDDGDLWKVANPTRLTAPVAGDYQISWSIEWAANAAGRRTALIYVNRVSLIEADSRPSLGAADTVAMAGTALWRMAADEFIELGVMQTSGANLNVLSLVAYSPELMMVRL